ncbi:hypothetical protein CcCBS67573_g07207 [Chytriomyces confervae]|uniref:FAD-binding domain-containing protein n=1 Tax=Chytriomyces confervae TaxID=246404 RepID=A0A507EYQ3_9FUNG|nr:hypothetical protein CcCBS67573_g07207 [Chytriomyces confervae]
MKCAIIGSGLVGAATALALHQVGITCNLYDQIDLAQHSNADGAQVAVEFGETGGSVLLAANALRVIKALGLLDELVANSSPSPFATWHNIDGSGPLKLNTIAINARMEKDPQLHAPLQILRCKLHSIFMRACHQAGIRTYTSKKLVRVDDTPGSPVVAHFADGTTASADFIIGADGIHSSTRRAVFGSELKAQYTGVTGYIGVVDTAAHNIDVDGTCDFYLDRVKKQLVCTFKISDQISAIQVMTLGEPDEEETDGWRPLSDLPKHAARLADVLQGWGVPKSVEQMMRHAYRISPATIYDLPNLKTFHQGRVAIAGDAAHGMVPNAGLGLGTGLEDVGTILELFRHMPNLENLDTVLSLYSELRVPAATSNAQKSREMAQQSYSVSFFGPGLNNFLLKIAVFAFNRSWLPFYEIFDCPAEVAKKMESLKHK